LNSALPVAVLVQKRAFCRPSDDSTSHIHLRGIGILAIFMVVWADQNACHIPIVQVS
jgi:hypothetical protein